VIVYLPDPALDTTAVKYGKDLRDILLHGSGRTQLQAYVNYAHGDESLESLYGFEKWRLEKLRSLKRQYDPEQRYSFYAPIH
jgi:hypothetical protein